MMTARLALLPNGKLFDRYFTFILIFVIGRSDERFLILWMRSSTSTGRRAIFMEWGAR